MQNPPAAGPREQLTTLAALAGNRATGQLVARLKQQDALPEHAGLDIAPLLAAQVPELLPLIPADQIKALQRDYDNDASNKELDRRHAKRRADLASGRVPGALMDSEDHDDLPGAVHGHYKPVTGPLSFELRTEDVLSDDILQEPAKNKALEMAFRTWMHDELLKHPTVHASIDLAYVAAYKNNGQTGTTNEAVIHWGSRALPHTRGKVHFKDLVENTFAKEYHDRVTDAPELQAMRREIAEILVGIDELKAEHEERIRLNGEHPVVRRVAEFLGGGNSMLVEAEFMMDVLQHPEKGTYEERQDELSTQCPDLDIWSEPKIEAAGALAMVKNQDFEIGLLAYMRAETSFERAARRYRRYENRVMKGAGIAVKWLERAKFAGKLAAGAIPGGGVLDAALMAAMYTLAQEGGQQAAEVAQGQRSGIDFAGLAKQATMDGAMAFFGGLTQGAFTRALEARIAAAEGAAAVGYAGNKLIVGTTSAAASAVYTIPANMVLQKIIYGKAHLPASADELAKMVLDEASTAVLTDAAMQGVHHTFGEGHARGAREEARSDGAKPAEGHAGPAGTAQAEPGGAGAPRAPASENGSPATGAAKKLELVELAERVGESPASAAKLIDHFGTWEATVGSVKGGAGELRLMEPSARAQALEGLVKHREAVEQEVAKFGAEPSKKAGVADAESAAELTVKGDDAGLKVAQATEHLEAAHPGWQQRLRMRVEMDGARTKSISQSIASLPKPLQESLAQYRADAGDMLSAWREARGAQTP